MGKDQCNMVSAMMDFSEHAVTDADKSEIAQFSQEHPWKPSYPVQLVRRFLAELTSSNRMIFDLHNKVGRLASAVLIDRISNPANDACLEILGMRELNPFLIEKFIALAKERTPSAKSGFQYGVEDNTPFDDAFFKKHGLKNHYETYEMENRDVQRGNVRKENLSKATRADFHDVYNVLCNSFSKNPETSIPPAEVWEPNFLSSPRVHFYLWRENGKLLAFANLVEPENADITEVRTIGVLPEARGRGLGQDLLQHCLNESLRLGFKKSHLTVAVENEKALGLYLRSGFKITEKYRCYRWTKA
jgi:ribosomal protein S18 acetylase RimI-like enzyme